jgi:mutator protein MutT
VDGERILLAMKKRGFGVGKWNGLGGKVQVGETIRQAAIRELEEEACVSTKEENLEHVATIDFHFEDPSWDQQMRVFIVHEWIGEPQETDEMAPQWHPIKDIPYESMWIDDRYWLPRILAGEKLKGAFRFTKEGAEIAKYDLEEYNVR